MAGDAELSGDEHERKRDRDWLIESANALMIAGLWFGRPLYRTARD